MNGTQQTAKKKKSGKIALIIILCIFGFAALMGILFGEEDAGNNGSGSGAIASSDVESKESVNTYEQDRELTTFNGVKATFMEVYDPKTGVTALAIKVKLENNGSSEVTVLPVEGYVNDTSVQFMSGLPVTIAPGKNAVGVYTFGYNDLGFSNVEDIDKMEFKLGLMSSDWSGVKKSETVQIDF
ncbi:MAG: hypothetical protein IJ370_04085 [Oscillospiraceae bacterium]|nr:hypothetical protein [Oscillospiraceae bacterium]MBQ8338535.1 hypothetical protein [Oscillospiraceae bacterium]